MLAMGRSEQGRSETLTPMEAKQEDGCQTTFREAIREALIEEMDRDERVFLMGEDIGRYQGTFRVTEGLFQKYGPHRVWDTPISEPGFIAIAIGAAIDGLRPVAWK